MIAVLIRIAAFCAAAWPWLQKFGVWLGRALNNGWAWLVAWIGITWATVNYADEAVGWLLAKVGFSMPSVNTTQPTGLAYALSVANTFMPLTELFGYLAAYGLLIVALNGYRVAKVGVELVDKVKPGK